MKSNLDGIIFIIRIGLDEPDVFFCPRCEMISVSEVRHEVGNMTFSLCLCLTFFTVVGGLIPLCWSKCKNRVHFCKSC